MTCYFKIPILMLACVLGASAALAQGGTVTVRGTVTDGESREPVPFATIYSADRSVYTSSNEEGEYVLKLPAAMRDARVVFALLGYTADTVSVGTLRKDGDVRLMPRSVELREVSISAYKDARSLMEDALRRIPDNYHTDTMVCTAFFRRASTANDSLFLFVEHVADLLRVGYGKNPYQSYSNSRGINSNYVAMRKLRLMDFDTMMLERLTRSAWTVRYLSNFMEGNALRDRVEMYGNLIGKPSRSATVQEYTGDDGTEYYIVKDRANTYTLEKGSLAIVRIERHTTPGTPMRMPITYLDRDFKKMCPLRKFNVAVDEVYVYGKVGDRYTLVSYNITNTTTYINETRKQWEGVVPRLEIRDYTTFQLIGQRQGDRSFLRDNGIDPNHAKSQPYAEMPVSNEEYSEEYWEQFGYVPVERHLLDNLSSKRQAEGR